MGYLNFEEMDQKKEIRLRAKSAKNRRGKVEEKEDSISMRKLEGRKKLVFLYLAKEK